MRQDLHVNPDNHVNPVKATSSRATSEFPTLNALPILNFVHRLA